HQNLCHRSQRHDRHSIRRRGQFDLRELGLSNPDESHHESHHPLPALRKVHPPPTPPPPKTQTQKRHRRDRQTLRPHHLTSEFADCASWRVCAASGDCDLWVWAVLVNRPNSTNFPLGIGSIDSPDAVCFLPWRR